MSVIRNSLGTTTKTRKGKKDCQAHWHLHHSITVSVVYMEEEQMISCRGGGWGWLCDIGENINMLRYTETCGGQNCPRLDTCCYKTVDGGAVSSVWSSSRGSRTRRWRRSWGGQWGRLHSDEGGARDQVRSCQVTGGRWIGIKMWNVKSSTEFEGMKKLRRKISNSGHSKLEILPF